jgi:pimeloyl-ACP methyl ester carboxylesterase
VQSNGIKMRVAEMGSGPLVVLLHGWPESWYSWRYQLPELAKAGYHVVAPDMRGYGATDAPPSVEDYTIQKLAADVVGLLDAMGESQAIVVGHDWGAVVAWNSALIYPDRFRAVVCMSVPLRPRPPEPPTATLRRTYGEKFYYMLYFQEPGVAERELERAPRELLTRIYATSPTIPKDPPSVSDPSASAAGLIPRLGKPREAVPWMSGADLDYYVSEFQRAGFRGGLNYYRNLDRNWQTTTQLADAQVRVPTLFIAGDKDGVIAGATKDQLAATMAPRVPRLQIEIYPNTGHWVQQERADEVNKAIVKFLAALPPP